MEKRGLSKLFPQLLVLICLFTSGGSMASTLDALKSGNKAFVEGKRLLEFPAKGTRLLPEETQPIAVVVASSDIAIPPESLFQSKPGELVAFQNAGPIFDEMTLDSIQYYCKEKGIDTVVLLASESSKFTEFALETRATDKLSGIKGPILSSLVEIERDEGKSFTSKPAKEKVGALTKRYISNVLFDLREKLSSENVEVHAAVVKPENGSLEWINPIQRKSGAPFGKSRPWGWIPDAAGL